MKIRYNYRICIALNVFCVFGSMNNTFAAAELRKDLINVAQPVAISPANQYKINGNHLIMAVKANDKKNVEGLVSDVNLFIDFQNQWGWSALHAAACGGYRHLCILLLRCNATVDIVDIFCRTPFSIAMESGHTECAALLSRYGASLDGLDSNNTPLRLLFRAAQLNRQLGIEERIKFLLKAGANPHLPNDRGTAPLDELVPGVFKAKVAWLIANTKKREIPEISLEGFNRPFSTRFYSGRRLIGVQRELIGIQDERGVDEDGDAL